MILNVGERWWLNGIGREFWDRVVILKKKGSRAGKPVASVEVVHDVTERPWNEVIVVVEY